MDSPSHVRQRLMDVLTLLLPRDRQTLVRALEPPRTQTSKNARSYFAGGEAHTLQ
jgi:hypothetical protein